MKCVPAMRLRPATVTTHKCPAASACMQSTIWRGPGRVSTGPNCPPSRRCTPNAVPTQIAPSTPSAMAVTGTAVKPCPLPKTTIESPSNRMRLSPEAVHTVPSRCSNSRRMGRVNLHSRCGWPFGSPRNFRRTPSSEPAHRLPCRSRMTGHIKLREGSSFEPYTTKSPEVRSRAMPLVVPSQMSPELSCCMERTLSLGSPSRMVRIVTRYSLKRLIPPPAVPIHRLPSWSS